MTRPNTSDPAARRIAVAALAALAGLAAVGTLAGCATGGGTTGSAAEGGYADGTYTADGDYQSPNGAESITVTVTIADDVVTAVEVVPHATGGNSALFQGQFASGIAAEVVGVPLQDVSVSRVAGSSLTSGGFNAAIDAIQAQAQG